MVKKIKKFSEKSGPTSEEGEPGGGGYGFCRGGRKQGMPWGLFTGSKAQKSYYLRTKHTISRK